MTGALLFRDDAYRKDALGRVVAHSSEGGVILDRTLFYPTGGGQPGDSGWLRWGSAEMEVAVAVKGQGDQIVLQPRDAAILPPVDCEVTQHIDWDRRFGHMRVHTALHLLSVVVPFDVSGGSIGQAKGRLDFNMPDSPEDKRALQEQVQAIIDRDLPVVEDWITDAELDANPQLVKTMSVSPPRGAGHIRLIRIGTGADQVDLQPCGGTHVGRTAEIGRIRLGKVEKKGRQNRRIYLHLEP
ncbi:MAG: alanyl-tRNA editing protein [Paracoccaceae bacterium]|uniref:alanyl-tRNA editing protein n=1 Tax=Sulfitobacter sp. TaxID=1903071 RepID=UPI004057D898